MTTHNPTHNPTALTIELILEAQQRLHSKINRTPVMSSATLDAWCGARLFFKCENFQKAGSFKARGATNAVFALGEDLASRGVVAHSSGNHAAALARAARLRSIPAHIVMPCDAPRVKQASVHRYGGQIVLCEPTQQAREAAAERVVMRTGATLVHSSDNLHVMAGQGTVALELLEEIPDLDLILCPVGGGGLLSGVAVAANSARPGMRIVAVEPAGADDAFRSFAAGRLIRQGAPVTMADGLRASLSERAFDTIREHVHQIVLVSEPAIARATRLLWEVMKLVVEPSAAIVYAAILEQRAEIAGSRIGLILTGGNVDLDSPPWLPYLHVAGALAHCDE